MVLMTVSQYDSPYFMLVFFKIGKVRDDRINARHLVIGKSETAVNYEHIIGTFVNIYVFPYLIKTAKGKKFKRRCFYITAFLLR